jgi:dTDP-4-dehydrorhamnose reductase
MGTETTGNGRIELWGGVECTVNRVGDEYFDQLERNGHAERIDDLDLFAELGIRAIRYPVLWERTAPDGLESADWSWADARLARLRKLDIRPIVGLVHHGSGPRHTSLVDPAFPEKLAGYARAVAERYPWVDAYTPVNEPLTTARFSGRYGLWYPHGRDRRTLCEALLIQCRAVALSMRAIREVNPAAQLVQTDDLGKTYSTPKLRYQADLENERRWLSFELLTGRVNREHSMWTYFTGVGIDEAELLWFTDNPCPPDVIGINHYLTSERFLDERLERYPACSHGGNTKDRYADVEAVRVCAEGLAGHRTLLRETWERYELPIAVTEVHLGCTREEQLRWFKEVWETCRALRGEGVDVRAVTAWSLLGAYDWNKLLTCSAGFYEPGVFDVRGGHRRPTAIAHMLRALAGKGRFEHPAIEGPGWWQRLERLLYTPVRREPRAAAPAKQTARDKSLRKNSPRPLIIAGATGTLGSSCARLCEVRGISYRLLSRREMDIADHESVRAALNEYDPWAIVNAAGYVRVDQAEHEPEACFRENRDGAATLAAACAERGISLLTFSSDLVFDGTAEQPYLESAPTSPLNVYGRSKAEAEGLIRELHPAALIVRTSAFFSPWDEHNFVTAALRSLASGETFTAADDAIVSPTYVPDLVNVSLDLLIDGERGIWHLANSGAVTWAELARRAAQVTGLDASGVRGCATRALDGTTARRPRYSVLGSERGALLPSLDEALARYASECAASWTSELQSTRPAGVEASTNLWSSERQSA